MSGDGHDYIRKHGTQEEQAARQSRATHDTEGGPWCLQRWTIRDGSPVLVTLPNSTRSTHAEAEALVEAELARADIRWAVVPAPTESAA